MNDFFHPGMLPLIPSSSIKSITPSVAPEYYLFYFNIFMFSVFSIFFSRNVDNAGWCNGMLRDSFFFGLDLVSKIPSFGLSELNFPSTQKKVRH